MPPVPAGTVTVSDDDGTSGAAATKAKVVGVACSQVPGTAGVSVGTGEWADSASENTTVMVASLGTPEAPSAGVTATTLSGRLEAAGLPAGVVVGDAETLPDECPTTATPTATATAIRTTPAPSATRCQRLRPAEVDRKREWEWEPDIGRSPPNLPGGTPVPTPRVPSGCRPPTHAVAEVLTWACTARSTA